MNKVNYDGKKGLSGKTIGLAVAVVVVLAAVVAIVSSGGNDSVSTDTTVSGPTTTGADGAVAPAESQPVQYDGNLPMFESDVNDMAVGQDAPALQMYGFNGQRFTLDPGVDGKPMMLVFLAHWCPHCNAEIPVLNEWQKQGLVPEDLNVIGITTGTRTDQPNYPPSKWIQDMEWSWAALPDSEKNEAAYAYGVTGFPTFVVIGGDGLVKYRGSGEKSLEEVDAAVKKALALT
ncbi:MAG: TlpA family protein disulfide reductase [Actinobacteria bacterium]|nr:TlpA family protein disulfide reductase [Actinomycetota bacterium]